MGTIKWMQWLVCTREGRDNVTDILFFSIYFLLPFCWWVITARQKESFFAWIGLKKITPEKSLKVLVLFTVVITYLSPKYLTPLFMPPGLTVQSQYGGMGLAALPSILLFGLKTGFPEEFFYRGFLLKRLQNKFGFDTGNLIQAVIFALPHGLPLILISNTLWFPAIMCFLLSGFSAWLYGYISEKSSGGSIIPAILLHGLGNVAVSLLNAFNLM